MGDMMMMILIRKGGDKPPGIRKRTDGLVAH